MQSEILDLLFHTKTSLKIRASCFRTYAKEWETVFEKQNNKTGYHNTKEYCDKMVQYWLYKAAECEYLITKAPVKIVAIYEDGKEQTYE
jgi:hypothetical protein